MKPSVAAYADWWDWEMVVREFLILLAMAIVSCSQAIEMSGQDDQPIFLPQGMVISESELPQLEREALGGSAESAFRLFKFYEYVESSDRMAFFWVAIAAENGHPAGQYDYAVMLKTGRGGVDCGTDGKRERDKIRAEYWARRAEEGGTERATERLKEWR